MFTASKKGKVGKKEIKEYIKIQNDQNIYFYIINYENGGFIILSADNRKEPVLAFSELNSIDVKTDFSCGFSLWVEDMKRDISYIRQNNLEQSDGIANLWNKFLNDEIDFFKKFTKLNSKEDPIEPDCTPYWLEWGPYISTVWGQRRGFNDDLPYIGCSNDDWGQPLVGCVGVATAKIMRYHEYPNFFYWPDMPDSTATAWTASLMYQVDEALNMNYGCTSSSASTRWDVPPALKNDFEYSSAKYSNYYYPTVRDEIKAQYPVILRGKDSNGDGHAWVTSGFKEYVDPCYGSTGYLYMQWGWYGANDGWFGHSNFDTYNNDKGMVYDIRP